MYVSLDLVYQPIDLIDIEREERILSDLNKEFNGIFSESYGDTMLPDRYIGLEVSRELSQEELSRVDEIISKDEFSVRHYEVIESFE